MPTVDEIVDKATAGDGTEIAKVETPIVEDKPKTPEPKPEDKEPKEDLPDFTAAEVVHEDTPTSSIETAPVVTDGLNDEQKYIVDNLPVMVARIKDGSGVKELQVKSWTQLPEDVEFASKRDELAFMNALTAQENRATSLQNQFRSTQATDQAKKFEEQEDNSVWDDVADLQDDGLIEKFTGPKDNPTFKTDAEADRVEAVVTYMKERNAQYLAEYNQGRPYRHIGFKEAFYMYDRQHPTTRPEQTKEDENRREVAEHLNVNRGLAAKEFKRPLVKQGTRLQDIIARIDAQEEL